MKFYYIYIIILLEIYKQLGKGFFMRKRIYSMGEVLVEDDKIWICKLKVFKIILI